tara:strand:- start:195 stop:416 length:222 start_codon:yes stop_codon:yes gene_type:complete
MSLIFKINRIVARLGLDPIELSGSKDDAKISFASWSSYHLLYKELMACKRSMAGYSVDGKYEKKMYTLYVEAV